MDRLVALDAKYCGAQYLAAFCIDHDSHRAIGLAAFDGAAYLAHRHGCRERFAARFAHLSLGHAYAAERGIGEESVGHDALRYAPSAVIENIGGDDLII